MTQGLPPEEERPLRTLLLALLLALPPASLAGERALVFAAASTTDALQVEGGLRLRVTEGLSLWVPDAAELAAGARAAHAVLAEDILLSVGPSGPNPLAHVSGS